ncbi:hypothetical protein [Mycolicibacterium baixiangningiae]|uniref:hypothetical protein n=1 Tax=Mycolicibacterium baixiangningiae TaxID=2761578 RepID=UPI0018D0C514|nr:hypothetical protein [Mycolicibacterium baixiangningiae]
MSLRELYDRYLAAWAGRDPDAIVALHADQTTFWLHDGRPACFDCMDLVTVTDDWRVARKDTFVDGAQFLRALGG